MLGSKIPKRQAKTVSCLLTVLMTISASANDGKVVPLSAKASVPINYYEWFMVGVAFSYALYLVIRAKRRAKRHTNR